MTNMATIITTGPSPINPGHLWSHNRPGKISYIQGNAAAAASAAASATAASAAAASATAAVLGLKDRISRWSH